MSILIKNGFVVDPVNGVEACVDVYVADGKICCVGENLTNIAEHGRIIDAKGLYVTPGFVDMHAHLREPGYEYKEDIQSGTASAAMGGFTSVACMPNTNPVADNAAIIRYILEKAKAVGVVDVYPIGAISKEQKGLELAEIGEMAAAGAVAVSDDGRPVASAELMKNALKYASCFGIPVISHCEELSLVGAGVMNEGFVATRLGLRGIPRTAEEVMIAREILISLEEGLPVHIAHVSTSRGVEMIRNAKKKGAKITCETCPHYFSLTEEAVLGYNTNAKMNPPLRSQEDVEAIKAGLADGTIDVIATDHAPHHLDEKRVEFDKAQNGIIGFETALPLALTYLVLEGRLTVSEFVMKMAVNPAKILGLNKGSLCVGAEADIAIWDKDRSVTIDVSKFASKSKNSPFDRFNLKGCLVHTIFKGNLVVENGTLGAVRK